MTISGISGSDPTNPSGGPSNQIKGTQDEFLRLFMAQLQHQDPFAPTSGADMVAQLAQLSAVEQQKSTNDQLAELAAAQNSASNAALSNLVGRNCDASLGVFEVDGQGTAPPPIDLHVDGATKGASIVITDANGKEVRRIPIPDGTRDTSVAWDGKDGAGQNLASGAYKISIDAGSSPAITASWHGTVDAVELTGDGPRLRMGSLLLAPGDIRTIGGSL
jgi:flagellar basal-body rod modification protein FlgD